MKIIITGSRVITEYNIVEKVLNQLAPSVTEIIEGGARGVDLLAKKWALENEIKCIEISAEWDNMEPPVIRKINRYGKEYNALAGLNRNEKMAKMGNPNDTIVLAIWDGKSTGTKHMIEISSKKYHLPVIVVLVGLKNGKYEIINVKFIIPSKPTTVVNLKKEEYDVYIGRGSKWGNPFKIGPDGSREEVIAKYREYILQREDLLNSLNELKGKRLGCYCKPLQCHGDVLVELIEGGKNG